MSKIWYNQAGMHLTLIDILAIYFAAVLGLSWMKRRTLRGRIGKTAQTFRALVPSWRFFEDFDDAPALYYRVEGSEEWKACVEKLPREFHSIFHNPRGNSALAAGSLVQQLLSDIESADESRPHDTEGLVSYQLAKQLVVYQLFNRDHVAETSRYQFKVAGDSGDVLISPYYALNQN